MIRPYLRYIIHCLQPLSKYAILLLRIGYIHGILGSGRASTTALEGMLEERIGCCDGSIRLSRRVAGQAILQGTLNGWLSERDDDVMSDNAVEPHPPVATDSVRFAS